jgi:hypothetical protein
MDAEKGENNKEKEAHSHAARSKGGAGLLVGEARG